jgi:hypothetical protein
MILSYLQSMVSKMIKWLEPLEFTAQAVYHFFNSVYLTRRNSDLLEFFSVLIFEDVFLLSREGRNKALQLQE